MAFKTLQTLIFLGLFATSCLAEDLAPAPGPITFLPPVESPPMFIPPVESPLPVIPPTAEPPSHVASPPVSVNEPTPAPETSPMVSPPITSPIASPLASPPISPALAPGPADALDADSALTNRAFFVSTVLAGVLYALVLA